MASIPRPLVALLAVVVVFFAAWMTVLKPSSSSSPSAPAPQVAVHTATTSVHAQSKPKASAVVHSAAGDAASTPAKLSPAQRRLAAVESALRGGQVLALLFYNPAGADDQAVRQEIAAIPSHKGKVFKLAIPVQDLSSYSVITSQVPVTGTPTLVVIDSHHRASTLAGFADQLEINQLVAGALSAK